LHNDQSNAHRQSISLKSGGTLSNLYMKVIAGTGTAGFSGDNGQGFSAQVKARFPWVDSVGIVYIADADNYRIRKINSARIISTFGGTGSTSTTGTSGPIGTTSFVAPWSIVGDTAGTTYIRQLMAGNEDSQYDPPDNKPDFPSPDLLQVYNVPESVDETAEGDNHYNPTTKKKMWRKTRKTRMLSKMIFVFFKNCFLRESVPFPGNRRIIIVVEL
jgi:hypothetical protein